MHDPKHAQTMVPERNNSDRRNMATGIVSSDDGDRRPAWARMGSTTMATSGQYVAQIPTTTSARFDDKRIQKNQNKKRNYQNAKREFVCKLLGVRVSKKHTPARSSRSVAKSVASSRKAPAPVPTVVEVDQTDSSKEATEKDSFQSEVRQPNDDISWIDSIRDMSESGSRAYHGYAEYLEQLHRRRLRKGTLNETLDDDSSEDSSLAKVPPMIYVIEEGDESNEEEDVVESAVPSDMLNELFHQLQSGDANRILDQGQLMASSISKSLPPLSLDPEGHLAELSVSLSRMASVVETSQWQDDDWVDEDDEEGIIDKLETVNFH